MEEEIIEIEEVPNYDKLRYILNKEGYIYNVSFGGEISCDLGNCTEYTGEIPNGYSSIEEWYENEIDKLNAWKIIDGNLVYDENKYNELKKKLEIEEEENKCSTHKWVNDKFNLINGVYDDELSTTIDGSSLFSIENTKSAEIVSMKITPNELIKEDLTIGISNENMLENKAINQTIRGVQFKVNEDKSITLNGTCECGSNLFNVNTIASVAQGQLDNGTITTDILNTTSVINVGPTYTNLTLEAGTYYLSCDIRLISGTASVSKINDWKVDWTKVTAPTLSNEYQRYVYTRTYTSSTSISRILFQFQNATNAQIEIKDIMISKDNDTTYEPYQEYLEYDILNSEIDENKKSQLPNEYQQVEYIESTGTQYIDTGYKPNQNTKIETQLEVVSKPTTYGDLFGSREANINQLHIIIRDNGMDCRYGTNQHIFYNEILGFHEIIFDKNNVTVDGDIYTYAEQTFSSSYNAYIFGVNNQDDLQFPSNLKLYTFKIYDNDVLVHDYIPCYRKSDKEVGLYDLVNNTFYTNQGTGAFSYGKNIYDYKKYLFFVNNENYNVSGFPVNTKINLYNFDGADKELIYSGSNGILNFDETKYITNATLQIPTGASFKNVKIYPMITTGTEEKKYVMSQGNNILTIDLDNFNFKNNDYIFIERTSQSIHVFSGLYPSAKTIVGSGIYPTKEIETILYETIEPLATFKDNTFIQCDKNVNFEIKYFPKDYINEQLAKIKVDIDEILLEVSETYATNEDLDEAKASIKVTTDSISSEVSKKVNNTDYTSAKIIAKINDDTSEAIIEADKISLAGKQINLTADNTTIKSTNFNVDKNGNVTMASATLTNGILKAGTKEIFNTSGVLSMFQYQCSGGEQNIGWLENYDMATGYAYYTKKGLQILYNIPSNFTIVNAYVVFTHIPCRNEINVDGNVSSYNGYARNVRLYSLDNFSGLKYSRYGWNGLPDYSSLNKTEITNSSGTNVLNFTGSASASTSKTTIDISSSLTKGSSQMLLIDTADTSVSGMADSLQKTAMGTATLFVIGYYKLS